MLHHWWYIYLFIRNQGYAFLASFLPFSLPPSLPSSLSPFLPPSLPPHSVPPSRKWSSWSSAREAVCMRWLTHQRMHMVLVRTSSSKSSMTLVSSGIVCRQTATCSMFYWWKLDKLHYMHIYICTCIHTMNCRVHERTYLLDPEFHKSLLDYMWHLPPYKHYNDLNL